MNQADSSETELSFVEEATWGVTPANPAWQRMRVTGEGLMLDKQTTQSAEITPNADVADEMDTGNSAAGPVNFELTFGDDDTGVILAHALRGSWDAGEPADDLEDLIAGTEKKSLTIEKRFELGATDAFSRFPGLVVNSLNLNLNVGEPIKVTAEFLGKGESTGTAELAGATYTAPNAARPMAAPDMAALSVGGVVGSVYYTTLSLTVNNNAAVRPALGQVDAIGVRYGQRVIEGTMNAYFGSDSVALYDLFVSGADADISFTMTDTDGDSYIVTMPRCRFITGKRTANGNNEDVMAEMTFRAMTDAVEGYAIKVQRTALSA